LIYIITPEGRLVNSGTTEAPSWSWEYDLKDHLGNVRAVISPTAIAGYSSVLQQTHYYPFGMRMSEISKSPGTNNRYLFNSKELQEDFGLNWYDYGARFYDPALGRWVSVDPMAELGRRWSTYAFCFNNPLRFIDPDGMWGDDFTGFIQSSPPSLYRSSPVTAFLKDLSAEVLNYASPLGAIDNAIETFKNPDATNREKFSATVEAAASMVIIVGEKAPVGEKAVSNITKNAIQGKQFEGKVTQSLKDAGHTNIAEQVTVKPNVEGAKNVRLDNVSTMSNGIKLTDAKSSQTAGMTTNQKPGYPAIENHGGTVVGNNGAAQGYPAGTKIPPTKVDIIRPEDLIK
jgi:RHS repeat-associated protein